eukprot:SAG11_NODE_14140_length_623_cov_1.956107_1_plen_22_part_10
MGGARSPPFPTTNLVLANSSNL